MRKELMVRYLLFPMMALLLWSCAADETTTGTGDNKPPYVVATDPADGDSNVALTSPITCTFSEPVIPSTVDDSSFIVTWIMNIAGAIICDGNKAAFSHAAPLRHNATYQAKIRKTVKDAAGNAMTEDYNWSFTTAAGPSVVETDPADGDTGVALNSDITATFSDLMDGASLDTSTFRLSDGVTGAVYCNGNQAVFNPDVILAHNHVYTATITKAVTDTAGNTMPNDYHWTFKTTGGPLILETYPAANAVSGSVFIAISATFSIDMDSSSFTPATFYLSDGVIGEVTYSNRQAKFVPEDTLLENHTYTATITSDVRDIHGNPMAADYSWTFTTLGEIMPMTVGNWWRYHVERWDTLGRETADYYDSIIIVRDTMIEMESWFVDQLGGTYSNRPDGLWKYASDGKAYLLAKYPADVGDTYVGCSPYYYPVMPTVEVLALDWQVTVTPGVYSCYRYYMVYNAYEPTVYYYYFSPDVGMILRETFMLHNYKNWPVKIERRALEAFGVQ